MRRFMLVALLFASMGSSALAAQPFIPLLEAGDAIPPIPLRAQDGRAFGLADLHGSAVAIAFVYTRCRDARMCPLVSAKFARAQHAIGSAPIRLVLLTLDPSYDTPPVLARYGRAFGQDPRYWTLATGSQTAIDELAGRLGIATAVTQPGTVVHTEAAVIIGPDGRIAQTVDGNDWNPDDLIAYARATLPSARTDPFIGIRAWLSGVMQRCGGGPVALGGTAILWILGLATAGIGAAFWVAFTGKAANET